MTAAELENNIHLKKSFLCVGLDSDLSKIPAYLKSISRPILQFNKQIIQHTKDLCVAYKINTAFYESRGANGWQDLQDTILLIPKSHFIILDAKRADIGNTAKMYAKSAFEYLGADAITLSPYMGKDSITPFLSYQNKWAIILALTSNDGNKDFQLLSLSRGYKLYEEVLLKSKYWGTFDNMMYVVGATSPELTAGIRKSVPKHFLLVPGIGAQGGNISDVVSSNLGSKRLLINASRSIIYAGSGKDFAHYARKAALAAQKQMSSFF